MQDRSSIHLLTFMSPPSVLFCGRRQRRTVRNGQLHVKICMESTLRAEKMTDSLKVDQLFNGKLSVARRKCGTRAHWLTRAWFAQIDS